ncbi:trans-2-enoyl-CoA reductase [Gymnopilus junonius]|uniref:enoyl-[acyl-carrier-protein] reductase n=1 Tax=Gymnopilus junonius TaxID=109634 RepID=A0A9P5NYV7_GYMJU|nr:trans-2-enoyl-CoA reductase [Gymnopilus junonius]
MLFSTLRSSLRRFSSSAICADRAVVYAQNGDPSQVLRVITYPNIPQPPPNSVKVEFLLSPINPADINVVEGVYPTKPTTEDALALSEDQQLFFVGGNEGLGRVVTLGPGVNSLAVGDWIIMTKQQAGTWATSRNVSVNDVLKVPGFEYVTEVQAATLTVNPPTAYNMLSEFIALKPGDWVIQNGANSAVGQAVIQIAAARGLKTINFIRDRSVPDLEQLVQKLKGLGATYVLTYDQLADKSLRNKIKEWTASKPIRLGLNCVGGKDTTAMARLLGNDAHLVSYGAMAKQPLSLPISLFIFKNLTSHGFWQSRWYTQRSLSEREILMSNLVDLMKAKKLDTPDHDIVTITAAESDEQATEKIQETLKAMSSGRRGRKILLKLESS